MHLFKAVPLTALTPPGKNCNKEDALNQLAWLQKYFWTPAMFLLLWAVNSVLTAVDCLYYYWFFCRVTWAHSQFVPPFKHRQKQDPSPFGLSHFWSYHQFSRKSQHITHEQRGVWWWGEEEGGQINRVEVQTETFFFSVTSKRKRVTTTTKSKCHHSTTRVMVLFQSLPWSSP